jgi:ammonia channel protein AmtB
LDISVGLPLSNTGRALRPQMLFAAITPLLMTGAFAERLRFWPALLFFVLWEVCVYYPVAHWVWGGGWLKHVRYVPINPLFAIHTRACLVPRRATAAALSALSPGRLQLGVLDFAGGIVVHTTAGSSS